MIQRFGHYLSRVKHGVKRSLPADSAVLRIISSELKTIDKYTIAKEAADS